MDELKNELINTAEHSEVVASEGSGTEVEVFNIFYCYKHSQTVNSQNNEELCPKCQRSLTIIGTYALKYKEK